MQRWTKGLRAMVKPVLAGMMTCALIAPVAGLAQGRTTGLVVFGDSLSDPGNAFALLGANNTPPDYSVDPFLVPDRPYARGGHHLSNGPTWIEQLAKSKGLAPNANPAYQSQTLAATNYAVAMARARDADDCKIGGLNFCLSGQVDSFLADLGQVAPTGALYVIEIGSNDLRDVAKSGNITYLFDALTSIDANIRKLHAKGAQKFLVWNAPKIAVTPAVQSMGPQTAAQADALTQIYNGWLDFTLLQLAAIPGVQIMKFDAYQAVATVYQNPGDFGLSNVTDPCIRPTVQPYFCQYPDAYMFWDGIHPTRVVHAIFATAVGSVLP